MKRVGYRSEPSCWVYRDR